MRDLRLRSVIARISPHLVILSSWLFIFRKVLTENAQFFIDWVNGYWLVLVAQDSSHPHWTMPPIQGVTSLEPWPLYYGGGWFALIGRIANLANEVGVTTLQIYRLSFLILAYVATAATYELLKHLGLQTSFALALSVCTSTSTYYITNAVGRGAYTEFVASSLIMPIIFALTLHIRLKNPNSATVAGIALTGLLALFLRTHNLSILMTAFFCLTILLLGFLTTGRDNLGSLRAAIRTGLASIKSTTAILIASVMLVSPDFLYVIFTSHNTLLGKAYWVPFTEFSTLRLVLSLLPSTAPSSTTPELNTQTTTLLFLFTLLLGLFLFYKNKLRGRTLIFAVLLICSSLVVTSSKAFWTYAPAVLQTIQYSYRYVTYVTLSIFIASVLFVLKLQTMSKKYKEAAIAILTVIAVTSVISASNQVSQSLLRYKQLDLNKVSSSELPSTWYAPFGFRQIGSYEVPASQTTVVRSSSKRIDLIVMCEAKRIHKVPVAASPLLKADGAVVVGSAVDGLVVLDIAQCTRLERQKITLRVGPTTMRYELQRAASLVCCFLLLVFAHWSRKPKTLRP